MFKYLIVLGFSVTGAMQAASCLGCIKKDAKVAGQAVESFVLEQVANGNAQKLAIVLLQVGLDKLDKEGKIEKNAQKFSALTGLKADIDEHGVIISSPSTGAAISYIPKSDRAQVLTAMAAHVITAHTGGVIASSSNP